MRTMIKDDQLTRKVRKLRECAREKVKEEVLTEYQNAQKKGKYPWEGMWLSIQEISENQDKLKKRDRIVFAEIMIFLFFLGLFCLFFFGIITEMLPG